MSLSNGTLWYQLEWAAKPEMAEKAVALKSLRTDSAAPIKPFSVEGAAWNSMGQSHPEYRPPSSSTVQYSTVP